MMQQIEKMLRSRGAVTETDAVHLIKLHAGTGMRNPKVSFVVLKNRVPFIFLKTVRFPADGSVIRHAHECLQRTNVLMRGTGLAEAVPQAMWIETCSGVPVSAETLMGGRPLRMNNSQERTAAFSWVEAYAKRALRDGKNINVTEAFAKHVTDLHSNNKDILAEINSAFAEFYSLAGGDTLKLPAVTAHADMTPSNMLIEYGDVHVIDWDRAGDIVVPLFDVLTLCERSTPKGESFYKIHRDEILRHADSVGVPERAVPLLCYWYILLTDWRKRDHSFPWEPALWDKELLEILRMQRGVIRSVFSE